MLQPQDVCNMWQTSGEACYYHRAQDMGDEMCCLLNLGRLSLTRIERKVVIEAASSAETCCLVDGD